MSNKIISAAYVAKVLQNKNVNEMGELINELLLDREFNHKQIELLQETLDKKSQVKE